MREKGSERISAVVVNFNGGRLLSECLQSLGKSDMPGGVRVSVVDNNSTDGSPEMIERDFSSVDLIKNYTNVGFAIANNQALRKVRSEFIALINPDVIVAEDTLRRLTKFLVDHPEAAIVGPKQVNKIGVYNPASKMGQATAANTTFKYLGLHRIFPHSKLLAGYYRGDIGQDETAAVEAVSGACLVARTGELKRVNFFDERFPLGCEDLDLCYRIGAQAMIYYFPEVVVVHEGRQSRKRSPELSILRFTEGAKLLYQKYESGTHPEWYNHAVIRGLDLLATTRIGITRLRSRTKKR